MPLVCPLDEESGRAQDDLLKDGPVRVIVRNGRVVAYGSYAVWTIPIPSTLNASSLRFSVDFSPASSGATFYNETVPSGVPVDGTPDAVPATPFSSWWQLSTDHGSIVQVADVASLGGTPSNYYRDDAALDPADTGDRRHYGDTGVVVATPNPSFTYRFALYFLNGRQSNVGTNYAAAFANPLQVSATPKAPLAYRRFVPIVAP